MSNLIDKDALVAEIDRQKIGYNVDGKHSLEYDTTIKILDIINTLELKEVDLDKEARHYLLYKHLSPLSEVMHQADLKAETQYHKDIENAFKAGFGLGISVSDKAQKGEYKHEV